MKLLRAIPSFATFELEYVSCGNCGKGRTCKHGPYWYAYWRERVKKPASPWARTTTDRLVRQYVGKHLPEAFRTPERERKAALYRVGITTRKRAAPPRRAPGTSRRKAPASSPAARSRRAS